MAQITSRLWKAAQLALHSTYFPKMVEAACWVQGKAYTPAVLYAVAVNQTIIAAIAVDSADPSVDKALAALMVTGGGQLDKAIMDAVAAYTPPAPPATP